MQPVGGPPPFDFPGPLRSSAAEAVAGDRVELGGSQPVAGRPDVKPEARPAELTRPTPPAMQGSPLQAAALSAALWAVPMLDTPLLMELQPRRRRGRGLEPNPSRIPVQPRHAIELRPMEPGRLQVVSTLGARITALRLHWPDECEEPARSAQEAVFHDLLTRTEARFVVVAEAASGCRLEAKLAEWGVAHRVQIYSLSLHATPERIYEPMTLWARDTALLMRREAGAEVLLLPRSFRGDGQVNASLNRVTVHGAAQAPALLQDEIPVCRSSLNFEGGDVIPGRTRVLIGGATVAQNVAELHLSREAVVQRFEAELGLPVVVVEPQPDFHLDLGITLLDEETVAVADPRSTRHPDLEVMQKVTAERHLADRYDAAAAALRNAGFTVVRLPNLCGLSLSTPYLTYNNVLIEQARVYMPTYGYDAIDEAARCVYRAHGYQVVDMPSARLSTRLCGAVRCAAGELGVERPSPERRTPE
ncbi:MAG: agmatine deiminase family protein [Candidatus Xenobia bacterium]